MNNNKSKFLIFATLSVAIILSMLVVSALPAAPVNLRTAGDFVILSKAAITDVNPSVVTGNVGASPITGASILLSCSEVTGSIYGVDAAYTGGFDSNVVCFAPGTTGGTPNANKTYVDTAVGDMGTAYSETTTGQTAGVGATNLNVGAGTLGTPGVSQNFVPGVYTWGTAVTITDDIYLNGNSTDLWVFQIAQTLDISSGKQVHLTGGAQAKNVFWSVAGDATIGTTAIFEGNILTTGTSHIAMLTGSTLHGRALSDGEVWLQSATVTIPGTIPPAPTVTNDDTLNTVTGMTAGMEYNLDSAVNYSVYNATNFSLIDFSGNHTLLVRVAAEGINPAGEITTLTFTTNSVVPPAPTVTNDDALNTVTGMTAGMEYNLDSAVAYVAYDALTFNALDFTGDHTLLVRVAAEGINPAGDITTLTFTPSPSSGSTSSGGHSSGGGGTVRSCETQWIVSEWNTCVNGVQTRTVSYTANMCTPTAAKPAESQSCTTTTETGTTTTPGAGTTTSGAPITGAATGIGTKLLGIAAWIWALIILAVALIVTFAISLFKKK